MNPWDDDAGFTVSRRIMGIVVVGVSIPGTVPGSVVKVCEVVVSIRGVVLVLGSAVKVCASVVSISGMLVLGFAGKVWVGSVGAGAGAGTDF